MADDCPKCEKGAPKWLTTYSDMVTLLLCFFVLMLSFANTDAQKFKEVLGAVKDAFGVQKEILVMGREGGQPHPIRMEGAPSQAEVEKNRLVNLLQTRMEGEGLQKNVFISPDKNGVKMEIMELMGNVMFKAGDSKLLPDAERLFMKMIPVIKDTPYKVTVQGHTDDIPITNSFYPSNWELSSSRAASVVRFFIQNGQLEAERFTAVGCAHTQPLVENDTPENRSKNRRVSIIIELF